MDVSSDPKNARGQSSFWLRLLKVGAVAAVLVAVLVWPAAWLLSRQAQTVQLIAPFDEAVVGVNRFTYEDEASGRDEEIVAIYGTPFGAPTAVLFVDEAKIIHPIENPRLALLPKGADENPLQATSVAFFARMTSVGAAVAAFFALLLLVVLRRRRARKEAAA